MSDSTITKYVFIKIADSALYAAMLTSQSATATSATNAAASATAAAASAASASAAATTVVNSRIVGTTNKLAKFTAANTVGNSLLSDDGTSVTFSGGNFFFDNDSPVVYVRKSNAPANQKIWRSYATDTQFVAEVLNDAFGAGQSYYVVARSAATISSHQWLVGGAEKLAVNSTTIFSRNATTHLGYAVTGSVLVEIGATRTDDGVAALDFHSVTGGATDYEARVIRASGTNGTFEFANKGTGAIRIIQENAGAIELHANNVQYAALLSGGAFKVYDQSTNKTNHLSIVGGSNGANIELIGNGATTPSKFIRAANGSLDIINSAYSAGIFMLSDAGVLNLPVAAGRYQIASTQVVGPRETGFAAMTGATNKATTYDTSTVTLAQLAGRVMALQAALTLHGLIGA